MADYGDEMLVINRAGVSADDIGLDAGDLPQFVDDLISRVSSVVETVCQRDFEHHTGETETLDGNDLTTIRLNGFPVISISSVKVDGSTLSTDEYRLKQMPSGAPGDNAGILERKDRVWPEDWENVEVTYDWGYKSPPEAIRSVVEDVAVQLLQSAGQEGTVESWSMDGYSVSFDRNPRAIIKEEHMDVLNNFKRRARV